MTPPGLVPLSSKSIRKGAYREPLPRRFSDRVRTFALRARTLPVAPALLVAALVLMGLFYRFVGRSEYFNLARIEIVGNTRIGNTHVLSVLKQRAGIEQGASLVAANCELAEREIARISLVDTVRVRRVWPDTLVVQISERSNRGIFIGKNGNFVFDEGGLLIAAATPADFRTVSNPLFSGLPETAFRVGDRLPERPFRTFRSYVDTFRHASPELAARLSEINYDAENGVSLRLKDGNTFACRWKAPAQVGPVAESLLAQADAKGQILRADFAAEEHLVLARAAAPKTDPLLQVAKAN